MELIEEDDGIGAEGRIVLKQPSEDPFRDHFDLRRRSHFCIESHAITDRSADRLAQGGGHAMGCGAGGKPSWFQHEEFSPI